MNELTNNEFKTLYTLIEKISYECNKRFKFKTTTHLSITDLNSLSFFFTIKYKGELHTIERNFHRIEIRTANYNIHHNLMYFIDDIRKELLKKIKEQVKPKKSQELKDNDLIAVCSKCLTASCWAGEFMCHEAQNAGTVEKSVSELKKLNLEHPNNWKKLKLF